MQTTTNLMLVGCGPHARRVYVPALCALARRHNAYLKVVVELNSQRDATVQYLKQMGCSGAACIFVNGSMDTSVISPRLKNCLDTVVRKERIAGVIIATEPLAHLSYALWAIEQNLHVLMDKPISTHKNVSNSVQDARKIARDFDRLRSRRNPTRAFIINAQRRYHPGFQYVLEKINTVARAYSIPITSMQSTHCDGQWRLPKEVLTQTYHPYLGYGKVSHSGYHLIDIIAQFVQHSFAHAGKNFDGLGVFSSFVRPTDLLAQQTRVDYRRVFGAEYEKVNTLGDQTLARLYKQQGEGEVDTTSVITLFKKNTAVSNIALNLMHNGFARRHWLLPGTDLYKGNGRVKHEYHNIEQGPYQNIQIHSYQANDKHDINTVRDYEIGGNNHFDIYIFRNSGIMGGEPLTVIHGKDISAKMNYADNKLMVEQIKYGVVQEFLEIVTGARVVTETVSDLATHALSARLMSLIYCAGIERREIKARYTTT